MSLESLWVCVSMKTHTFWEEIRCDIEGIVVSGIQNKLVLNLIALCS